jgi:hypothetical protein
MYLHLKEKNGHFHITLHDPAHNDILTSQKKLALLNSPEQWADVELKARDILKWKCGDPSWVPGMKEEKEYEIPVEIEATRRNLKYAICGAQIVGTNTGEAVDMFPIRVLPDPKKVFTAKENVSVTGKMKVDPKAVPLLRDGRLVMGRIVPIYVVFEGEKYEKVVFFQGVE